jgi:hypothetical protein
MPRVGFELAIPVFERAKIFHALGRAATVFGGSQYACIQFYLTSLSKKLKSVALVRKRTIPLE